MNIFGPKRQSIRLKGYDYASDGMYYVTLCTEDRGQIFGEVKQGEMHRSPIGEMIQKTWLDLPRYCPRLSLDEFMVMPDHFHGIIVLESTGLHPNCGQARGPAPTISLSDLMNRFKSWTTRQYWIMDPSSNGRLWQRNYYEHIIRNDADLGRIQKYIRANPENWLG